MKAFSDFDQVKVGDRRDLVKAITQEDIRKFVEMTGDDNPLHVDPRFAAETSFKEIVVHGMLGASFISTVIGTKLPGPGALWISQAMDFLLPVRLGDVLTISCTVLKKHERDRLLELQTVIVNQNGQTVLQGLGKVKLLEAKPALEAVGDVGLSRVAIVTGGSGGIGAAICRRLAADGFAIVLNYQGSAERAASVVEEMNGVRPGSAIAAQADVSTPEGVQALVSQAHRHFGPVGVLVNNASPRINPKSLADASWSDFQRHLDVQLKAAFMLSQQCAADMTERHAGRIINIGSQATHGTPTLHWTAYATAKAALTMFSRSLAAELGPNGITVNCVSPGMTETSMIGDISQKHQMMMARQTPLRRLASPDDIAAAVAHLASDDARYVTGQTLHINGGMVMPS